MRIELKAESQLAESERLGLARLSAESFPPDGDDTQWARSDWHVLVWQKDEIVSHMEIVERIASVGGRGDQAGCINSGNKSGNAPSSWMVRCFFFLYSSSVRSFNQTARRPQRLAPNTSAA